MVLRFKILFRLGIPPYTYARLPDVSEILPARKQDRIIQRTVFEVSYNSSAY